MSKYEVLYILRDDTDEATREAQIEKYSNLVKESGGEVENVNRWGMKKFAYPINFKKEGYYVLMNFLSNADLPQEMERQMKIADEVVRYLVVKK